MLIVARHGATVEDDAIGTPLQIGMSGIRSLLGQKRIRREQASMKVYVTVIAGVPLSEPLRERAFTENLKGDINGDR
jgi:hypothetical protein